MDMIAWLEKEIATYADVRDSAKLKGDVKLENYALGVVTAHKKTLARVISGYLEV